MVCLPQKGIYPLLSFSFSPEGDFEAFRAFVRATGAAHISVAYNKPNLAPGPPGEFTSTAFISVTVPSHHLLILLFPVVEPSPPPHSRSLLLHIFVSSPIFSFY